MTKLLKYARTLLILGTVLTATGCSALLGTIHVQTDLSCDWARRAPDLTDEQAAEIVASDISDATLAAVKSLDNWTFKHNELYGRNC